MAKYYLLILSLCFIQLPIAKVHESPVARTGDCVILLHGLARTSASMWWLKRQLKQHNYTVVNAGYYSMANGISESANKVIPQAVAQCQKQKANEIHFVTHSMGGILVRSYLQTHQINRLKTIVMLAPPNNGSEIVDRLLQSSAYEKLAFQSFKQLSARPDSYVNSLQPIEAEIGVIAGVDSYNPRFSKWLPGDDDGKVSVKSACLPEMKAMLVISANHTSMTFSQDVRNQVVHFLEQGAFNTALIEEHLARVIQRCDELENNSKMLDV